MSLSVALNTARASLATTAKQIAVSGSNIAGADDPGRTRKIAQPTTDGLGAVRLLSISRATDLPLFYRLVSANSAASAQNAKLDGLTRLHDTIGDPADGTSPSARIAALVSALQSAANAPNDRNVAQSVVTAARNVASSLNNATALVTSVRNDADTAMADSVTRLNRLLADFSVANTTVVRQTIAGEDATDALDRRDALLGEISKEVGITVVSRANNDVAVYTDGGVTVFDRSARSITFDGSILGPGVDGNAVMIDGIPVTGDTATMPIHAGNLAGLSALRDEIAPTYQAQLDELARGLVAALAESDQSGGGGPDLAGLLTWSGGPAIPAAGTVSPGIAGTLALNPAVDPSQGGVLDRLRDGGMNGVAYRYNPTTASAYGGRLDGMVLALNAAQAFDPASGLPSPVTVGDFGIASVGWLEDQRKTIANAADYQSAMIAQTSDALSNATGVNIDDEYALQLRLEQSYQASSKLINVINAMMQALLEAV